MPDRRLPFGYSLLAFLIFSSIIVVLARSFLTLDYEWDFKFLAPFIWQDGKPGLLVQGLINTIWISLAAIVIGTIGGVIVGSLLLSSEPVSKWVALAYVDVFRNTPVLVQLYVAYFVVGTTFDLSAEVCGVLTLGLFCSSYVADIYRGTILNLDRGQIDAAKSLGFSAYQVGKHVIAPQALRRMLPPLVGQFVTLVKDSSLVSVIGILDLTKSALNVVSVSFRSFETWFAIAIMYLVINTILSSYGRWLEHRLSASLR